MSVVNKMLQDLESRKKQSAVSADYVPKAKAKPKPLKPILFGMGAIVLLVSAQQMWSNQNQVGEPQEMRSTQASESVPLLNDSGLESDFMQAELAPHTEAEHASVNIALAQSTALDTAGSDDNADTTKKIKQAKPLAAESAEVRDEVQSTILSSHDTSAPALAVIEQDDPSEVAQFSVAPSNGAKAGISLLREQARLALDENNIAGAINALEVLIEQYPEDLRARKQLASILFSHNRVEQAQRVLNEGLAINPADNALRIMLARVAFKIGDYQEAHKALSEHPYPELADIELLSFRAALAERLSQYLDANHDYKLLVAREPQNAKWWLGLGVSQDKLKRPEQAIASYQQAKGLKQLPSQVDEFVEQRIAVLERQS